jgi:hypothetical protein
LTGWPRTNVSQYSGQRQKYFCENGGSPSKSFERSCAKPTRRTFALLASLRSGPERMQSTCSCRVHLNCLAPKPQLLLLAASADGISHVHQSESSQVVLKLDRILSYSSFLQSGWRCNCPSVGVSHVVFLDSRQHSSERPASALQAHTYIRDETSQLLMH